MIQWIKRISSVDEFHMRHRLRLNQSALLLFVSARHRQCGSRYPQASSICGEGVHVMERLYVRSEHILG